MFRSTRWLPLAAVLAICLPQWTLADLVVGYDALDTGSTPGGSLTAINGTNVTGVSLARGTGINPVASVSGQDYNSSNWNQTPDSENSWKFSFTSTIPYDLTSLQVRAQSFDAGPTTLRLEIDSGSGFVALGGDQAVSTASPTDVVFNFSVLNVLSASVRILGFNSSSDGNDSRLAIMDSGNYDLGGTADVVLSGFASVPEPGAFLFGGVACCVIGLVAAKRRLAASRQASASADQS